MEEVTREVLEKAKNISSLEDLLRAPKFRGGIGELFLGDLVAQILSPSHYDLQYKFKSGETVDAIIRIGQNIAPIDSRFLLENFQRFLKEEAVKEKEALRKKFLSDVKKHIDEIASKYILLFLIATVVAFWRFKGGVYLITDCFALFGLLSRFPGVDLAVLTVISSPQHVSR